MITTFFIIGLLANCCTSLPVIFGYHSPTLPKAAHHNRFTVDCNPTHKDKSANDLFVASVNQPIQRPMALRDNAISYNENVDRSNYIPIELDSDQEELPADRDFHPSYRRLVTRTIKDAPHYQYPTAANEETPIFDYNTATTAPIKEDGLIEKIEECFDNAKLLPRSTIKKMNRRRRKLARTIRGLNKLQRTYCLTMTRRPKNKNQTKCSAWRDEKMALYVKLLKLTHCSKDRSTQLPN